MTTGAIWNVPAPTSILEVATDDGTEIVLRRHGNTTGPRLLLTHGNGLAIDLYYPFWSLLLDDFDVVVYDLRNHGWNRVGSLENHNIPNLIRDHDAIVEAVERRFGVKPTIGVFHSVSALGTLLSPGRGRGYAARILLDPPLCRPGRSLAEFEAATTRMATMTRNRTQRFSSLEDLVTLLGLVPVYKNVVPGVPDLVARTTLRRSDDGEHYVLRCPRDFEARMVDFAGSFAVLVDFDSVECPTKVIGADPVLPYSYLPTLDFRDVVTVDYDFLPDATHLLPLERPHELAAVVREYIKRTLSGAEGSG